MDVQARRTLPWPQTLYLGRKNPGTALGHRPGDRPRRCFRRGWARRRLGRYRFEGRRPRHKDKGSRFADAATAVGIGVLAFDAGKRTGISGFERALVVADHGHVAVAPHLTGVAALAKAVFTAHRPAIFSVLKDACNVACLNGAAVASALTGVTFSDARGALGIADLIGAGF